MLADDLGQATVTDSAKAIHILFRQGWRGIHSDRRQLSRVADHYQAAVVAGADIFNKIFQKVTGSELGGSQPLRVIYADQRDLVHDKQFVGQFIGCQGKLAEAVISDGFLTVDTFVDCAGWLSGVQGENLGGTPGGSQCGFEYQYSVRCLTLSDTYVP